LPDIGAIRANNNGWAKTHLNYEIAFNAQLGWVESLRLLLTRRHRWFQLLAGRLAEKLLLLLLMIVLLRPLLA